MPLRSPQRQNPLLARTWPLCSPARLSRSAAHKRPGLRVRIVTPFYRNLSKCLPCCPHFKAFVIAASKVPPVDVSQFLERAYILKSDSQRRLPTSMDGGACGNQRWRARKPYSWPMHGANCVLPMRSLPYFTAALARRAHGWRQPSHGASGVVTTPPLPEVFCGARPEASGTTPWASAAMLARPVRRFPQFRQDLRAMVGACA